MADKIYMDASEKMELSKKPKVLVTGGRGNYKDGMFETQVKVDTSDCPYAGLGDTVTLGMAVPTPPTSRPTMKDFIEEANKTSKVIGIIIDDGKGGYTLIK